MYRFGLVGYPVEHSISPQIHKAALQAAGLTGEYRLYPVYPSEEGMQTLKELIEQMRKKSLQGLNVTIPHKQVVIPFLDELTSIARATGTVNTILSRGDLLSGDSTDAPGFLSDLKQIGVAAPGTALVLGAGGSARSIVYALLQAGWEVFVAARELESAQSLANKLRSTIGQSTDWRGDQSSNSVGVARRVLPIPMTPTTLSEVSLACQLLVNCTPVGMAPNAQSSPWPQQVPFPSGMIVYDLVYNPNETSLVRAARQAGLRAVSGLGMLIEQAALSFEGWTGQTASREAMYKAARQALIAM